MTQKNQIIVGSIIGAIFLIAILLYVDYLNTHP